MKRDVPHFRIGLLLTEAGIIEPVQLDAAIQRGEETGEPFLRNLVVSGYLKQHELQAVIRAQSLIWSGMLDVERAIKALTIVHSSNCTIEEGLSSVGWNRPVPSTDHGETVALDTPLTQTVQVVQTQTQTRPMQAPPAAALCQYCGGALEPMSNICPFCAGENQRPHSPSALPVATEPAWQRQAQGVASDGRVSATNPARDPVLMAMFSACCLPGLGQMLIGQGIKGALLLVVTLLISVVTGGIALLLLMPVLGVDAYLLADKLRSGKTVGSWEFF